MLFYYFSIFELFVRYYSLFYKIKINKNAIKNYNKQKIIFNNIKNIKKIKLNIKNTFYLFFCLIKKRNITR